MLTLLRNWRDSLLQKLTIQRILVLIEWQVHNHLLNYLYELISGLCSVRDLENKQEEEKLKEISYSLAGLNSGLFQLYGNPALVVRCCSCYSFNIVQLNVCNHLTLQKQLIWLGGCAQQHCRNSVWHLQNQKLRLHHHHSSRSVSTRRTSSFPTACGCHLPVHL